MRIDELQVGDTVEIVNWHTKSVFCKIKSVNKSFATTSNGIKLKKRIHSNGIIIPYGYQEKAMSKKSFRLSGKGSAGREEKIREKNDMLQKIIYFDFRDLNNKDLEKIIKIIEKKKTE